MWPKSIHGGYNCDVSIEPLKSETYTKGVTIRRDEYFFKESNLSNADVRCPNTLEAQSYIGIYKRVGIPEKRRILRQYICRI